MASKNLENIGGENNNFYIEDSLSKLARFTLQGLVGVCMAKIAYESSNDISHYINYYRDSIREFMGNPGYWMLQMGVPIFNFATFSFLGFLSVKGTGEYIKKSIKKDYCKKRN